MPTSTKQWKFNAPPFDNSMRTKTFLAFPFNRVNLIPIVPLQSLSPDVAQTPILPQDNYRALIPAQGEKYVDNKTVQFM